MPGPQSPQDVVILGGGPAALSLGAALSARGVGVVVLTPDPAAAWVPNYGLFSDELPDIPRTFAWDRTTIVAEREHALGRGYANIDKRAHKADLETVLRDNRAVVVDGRARAVAHQKDVTIVHQQGADALTARLVIDCSGTGSPFVERHPDRSPVLHQTAYGIELLCDRDPYDPGEMRMMDFDAPADGLSLPPTFVYAMPRGDRRWFIEETVLCAAGEVDFALLRQRLMARLAKRGVSATPTGGEEEFCKIRMNTPLPVRGQRLLAFGAAAAYVHPATGYSLGFCLRRTERVADAVAAHLDRPPEERSGPLWDAVWAAPERAAHRFYRRGGALLAGFDQRQVAAFFESFFKLKHDHRWAFLDRTATQAELYRIGVAQYARMSFSMKATFTARYPRTKAAAGVSF